VQYALVNLDVPATSTPLVDPPSFAVDPTTNTLALTLYVRANRITGMIAFNTRSFCTDRDGCAVLGPTLRIKAGSNFSVTLVNQLGPEAVVETMAMMNTIHSPNTTNMHTHGLHINPAVDTVFIKTLPGE
jgi:FtsP/CotA-like multicopper oxidase with cupredoxin domain